MASKETVIVTGASQGIGAAVVKAFLGRGYNVVATSRSVSKAGFAPSPNLALVEGDIGQAATAETVAQTAIDKYGSIDHVVKALHGLHGQRVSRSRLHQPGRVRLHHPARSQTDPVAGHRWQRDNHHGVVAREPHRGPSGIRCDDHQGRT